MLEAGDLRYEVASLRAWRGSAELELARTERLLLETFLRHRGQVLDRDQLSAHVWGTEPRSNLIDVYVRYLREEVDRPFGVHSIETVRG